MEEEVKPKELKKEDAQQSFLKELDDRLNRQKEQIEEYGKLVSRNEELAARKMLGGETSNIDVKVEKKEETPAEYKERIEREIREGKIK